MQLTLIGLIIFFAGAILLLYKSVEAMLAYTMICTLMGGSAAIILTALGSSSIPPVNVASVFLLLRLFMPSNGAKRPTAEAFNQNIYFLIFAAYALISAMLMPRIFADKIDVVPMRPIVVKGLFDVFPLKFTSQNITSPVYIIGSFLVAVSSFIALRTRMGVVYYAKTAIAICWIHVGLGLAGVFLPKPVWSVVSAIFRNGSYGQTDQTIDGYSRIAGIMPEASSYAAYGFFWFVLVTEFWLRGVMPRRAGPAAAALGLMLVFSTSSTAYVSLGGYAALIMLRMIFFPNFFKFSKIAWLVGSGLLIATIAMALMILKPSLLNEVTSILKKMTIDKSSSDSGLQRAFWARQGILAFKASFGLGIGAGSFRSSNLFTAILGSMGVIGTTSFILYFGKIFRPFRNSTFSTAGNPIEAVGVSSSWAILAFFIPATVSAPSPDPGAIFALLAGAALALRSLPQQAARAPSARAWVKHPEPRALAHFTAE